MNQPPSRPQFPEGRRHPPISPARAVALRVLLRVEKDGAYADRALRAEATELDPRDHALARTLVYGVVQRQRARDFWSEQLTERDPEGFDAPVRAGLRLGLLQIHYLDRIPEHAAVDESVELVKRAGFSSAGGLVNAVLRRALRAGLPPLPSDAGPLGAAVRHSVPDWVAERWFKAYGPEQARLLLAFCNEPAERAVRANLLKTDVDTLERELGVPCRRDPERAQNNSARQTG